MVKKRRSASVGSLFRFNFRNRRAAMLFSIRPRRSNKHETIWMRGIRQLGPLGLQKRRRSYASKERGMRRSGSQKKKGGRRLLIGKYAANKTRRRSGKKRPKRRGC